MLQLQINHGLKVLLLTILFGVLACSPSTPAERPPVTTQGLEDLRDVQETATIGTALIAVDESLRPIIEAEIASFEALFPHARVEARYLPGETAIREMLLNDSIRLVVSCRRLTSEEEAILLRRNINPHYTNILRDGVVLLVNTSNPVKNLTRQQMLGILSGEIRTWQELDPNAPAGEIVAVFDHAESSTISFLQDSILAGRPILQKRYARTPTSAVFAYIRENPVALGVIGLSWISDRDDPEMRSWEAGTRRLQLEKPDGNGPCAYEQTFFGPYQSYLDQQCYPLNRTVNTILREVIHGVGTGFVSFLDGPDGQRIVHKSGLAAMHTIPRRVKFPPVEGAKEVWESD